MIDTVLVNRVTSYTGNLLRNSRGGLWTAKALSSSSAAAAPSSSSSFVRFSRHCPVKISPNFTSGYNNNNFLIPGAGGCIKTAFASKSTSNNYRRWYSPMTKEEEDKEKARVSHLTPEEKEQELRRLNREIAKLETIRGINTGELYTWSGRYKSLVKNYGFPLFVYYWSLWVTMGGIVYLGIDFGGLDAMALLERIDSNLGWSVSEKVDPQLGE